LDKNNFIQSNIESISKDSNILLILIFSLVIGLLGFLFAKFEYAEYFPALAILLILLYYAAKSNDFWVVSSLMVLPFMLLSRDEEMKVTELFANAYLLCGLAFYFIKYHLIAREKIVENWGDLFLILFTLFTFTNIIIAFLNGVDFYEWLRGFLTLCLYLYYFPVKKFLKKKENLNYFLFAFCICIIAISTHHLNYIVYNAIRATFAYQLQSSLRINLTLMALAIFVSISFVFDVKSKLLKLLLIITMLLSTAAVITSFARATWLTVFALLVISMILLTRKQRFRILLVSFLSLIGLVLAFPNTISKADIYLKLVNKKFLSSTQGKSDISIRSRIFEYEGVYREINNYPISGSGINKKFSFKNILENSNTTYQTFTHNSFLHFWYMLGIPTTLCMIGFLIYFLVKSIYIFLIAKNMNVLQKKIAFITFCGLMIIILHSIISAQLVSLETIITVAISCSILNNELLLSFTDDTKF